MRPHAVDVLFVDEAGQMSLANVLAVSQAADSVVLLGDPQQLDQPQKATHPDGVGISALEHMLGGAETMPEERGIFLPITYRMSPAITAFTSELFYDGKLQAKPGLENQVLTGTGAYDGSRLWLVPVEHDGNQNASVEEVDAVERLLATLLAKGGAAPGGAGVPSWTDESGVVRALTAADIKVVAPFNAQVNRLKERLGSSGVEVGTVDKFQGQTAAVIIYSMTTSRPGGCAERARVPLQPEPAQRGDVTRALCGVRRLLAAAAGAGVPDAEADAAGERAVPVSGAGDRRDALKRASGSVRAAPIGPVSQRRAVPDSEAAIAACGCAQP